MVDVEPWGGSADDRPCWQPRGMVCYQMPVADPQLILFTMVQQYSNKGPFGLTGLTILVKTKDDLILYTVMHHGCQVFENLHQGDVHELSRITSMVL